MKTYKCYFDGSCEPQNPGGSMGAGVYITCEGKHFSKSEYYPAKESNTNNVAEYLAIIILLKLVRNKVDCIINIYGDSKLVVNQVLGLWKITYGAYVPFAKQAQNLFLELRKSNTVTIQWISRDQNQEADKLSKAHLTPKA